MLCQCNKTETESEKNVNEKYASPVNPLNALVDYFAFKYTKREALKHNRNESTIFDPLTTMQNV